MLLIIKFIYDSPLLISIPTILTIYAACSSVLWIKLFFFCPRRFLAEGNEKSVFQQSFVGSFCHSKNLVDEEKPDDSTQEDSSKAPKFSDYKKTILSAVFLSFLLFSVILTIRLNSFPIWCLPWLKLGTDTTQAEMSSYNSKISFS